MGIGSNLGDRRNSVSRAVLALTGPVRITGLRASALYETDPWGAAEGGPFLNAVAAGFLDGSPEDLLDLCREVERLAGAPERKHGAARTLDLDILCMEGVVRRDPALTLPHPRMALRRFVLVPLAEVWSGEVPGTGRTPAQLLAACPDPREPRWAYAPPVLRERDPGEG